MWGSASILHLLDFSALRAFQLSASTTLTTQECLFPIVYACVFYGLFIYCYRFLNKILPFALPIRILSVLWFFLLSQISLRAVYDLLKSSEGYGFLFRTSDIPLQIQDVAPIVVWIGVTKSFEFVDTLLALLQKRRLSCGHGILRLYSTIFWWTSLYAKAAFLPQLALLEASVRSIFYVYSILKGLQVNERFLKWIAPFLYFLRLVQFSVIIYYCVVSLQNDDGSSNTLFWNAQFLCANPTCGGSLLRWPFTVILLYMLGGFGITCGAHRLWAHRSYKAHWVFRTFLMLLNSFANQGSIYHWCRDHRVHHKYSEQEADPHNATRGFFFSHMGWLLLKKNEAVKEGGKEVDCSDLLEDPVVVFQKNFDPYWNQAICFLLPSMVCYFYYGSFWFGFFVYGCFRWVLCLHATWTVNSVAHLWGDRPYNQSINPSENLFTSLVAVGEGWHNWHHEYPFDYATSEGGIFEYWNPSKLLIDLAAACNLAWDRKRATNIWERVKAKRLLEEKKKAEEVAAKLKRNPSISKLPKFRGSLPAHVVKKSLLRSSYYVLRDFVVCFLIASMAILINQFVLYFISEEYKLTNNVLFIVCWLIYAFSQGTAAFGLWVLGYDAAGGRFCDYRLLNHITGVILHSALLIPYKPRRAYRERERASLIRCLSEDFFAIFKINLSDGFSLGGVVVGAVFALFAVIIRYSGWKPFFQFYVGPWIVLNCWLHIYEWLMENGPQDCFEVDLNEGTLQLFIGEWLLATWPKAIHGHRYPWNRLLDHFHHDLCLSHVVQAVDFNVPHYNVKEAVRRLGELLGEVSNEVIDAKHQFVGVSAKTARPSNILSSVIQ
ncbi:putative fatty acyl-CoA desaturase [Cardiosporidium cionae]|uniref:Fatty acyl-CoA desaturase n=1 Tax=Cardiosporidium cionae TaxID=476202 RepID=A0ABQ7J901_9APIC|nr:putative fatty acyl-CoA desaturase [Cardiosporidium cionae]|eukprot:KAF8820475.1 putative fatty acyl-CoA desaturase [Cardiosporidium cionae]